MNLHRVCDTLRRWTSIATLALLSACGSGDPAQDAPHEAGRAGECGAAAFPCSLDKVSIDVLDRGEALADQLVAMLGKGDSIAQALTFIRAQPGVADAAANDVVLRFRLAGGRDVFIFQPQALSPVDKTVTRDPPVAQADGRMRAQFVVGETPATKRALVLSPFKYSFAPDDDGAPVAQILRETRGYAGHVTYLENATQTAATVGIQQFAGWDAFDVIHVSSHGARVCDVNRCGSVILSGDIYSSAADLLRITETGVNTARVVGKDAKLLALGTEFFRKHYPAGLDRKIIFFNACQTYTDDGSGLGDVLRGTDTVYLGWTDAVESDAAMNAAVALFRNLSDNGVTVDAALAALGPLALNSYQDGAREVHARLLLDRSAGSHQRLREIVTLQRPQGGGTLVPGATVNAVGTADDGVIDGVPYQILIEGIAVGQQDAAIVRFSVNGVSSTPQAVTIGERVGETGWRLTGQIPFIDLAPEQNVEMVATVQLPEGGVSEHRAMVKLATAVAPSGQPETWVGEAVSHFDDSTPQGMIHITRVATVTFKQSPATVGGRYKVLRTTGGSIAWTRSGTIKTLLDGDCAYSTGPVQVPIAVDDGEIIIDTAATPNSYALSGLTKGPAVRVAENCGSYAFTTTTGGAWAPAIGSGEGFNTSPDGGSIGGQTGANLSSWNWTFRRQ